MQTYGQVSRLNHWIIAIAMIGMLGFGLFLEYGWLTREAKAPLVAVHRSIGVLVLIYGTWRVLWRLIEGFADAASAMPGWQVLASKIAHWSLLAGIVLMPLSGVAFTVFRDQPVDVFGWFAIPAMGEVRWIVTTASAVHTYVGIGLSVLVVVHIGAALKHHFVDRDATLRRMVSGRTEV